MTFVAVKIKNAFLGFFDFVNVKSDSRKSIFGRTPTPDETERRRSNFNRLAKIANY